MTSKQLARKLFKNMKGVSVKEFGFNTLPWEECIEQIAKQMYQDIKNSDLDLDCTAMSVVLYKIGEKLVKK